MAMKFGEWTEKRSYFHKMKRKKNRKKKVMASIEARTAKLYFIANGRFSHSGSHIVLRRASKLSIIAMNSSFQVVREVFSQSSALISSSLGYNAIYGYRHRKIYSLQDSLCVDFIRDVRVAPDLNLHLLDDIYLICTA